MDTTWGFQKNPVPWNFKKKKNGGVPAFLRESPIQCPSSTPYFNVYKVNCDLRNNPIARDLQNPTQPYYNPNRNDERFTSIKELKNELENLCALRGVNCSEDNPEEEEGTDEPLWSEDLGVLFNENTSWKSFVPRLDMNHNEFLNTTLRLSVVLFSVIGLLSCKPAILLWILVVALLTLLYDYSVTSDEAKKSIKTLQENAIESFTPPPAGKVIGGIGTSSFPQSDFEIKNGPAEFDDRLFKGTAENGGNLMQERNEVLSWDPFCPLSMERTGREFILTGGPIKRHLFY